MSATPPIILVVEDEGLLRMDLAFQLQEMGYMVLEATNSDEAIDLLVQYPGIAAVITDVDLPGTWDGKELAAIIRNRWPPCKLIMVSSYSKPAPDEIPEGARFISKPVPAWRLDVVLAELGLSAS